MSVSARAAVSALRFVKKMGVLPKPGDIDEEIEKAREYNKKHPYKQPSDHRARYRTVTIGGYPVLGISPKDTAHKRASEKKAVLFLHGGGHQDAWKPEIAIARNYGKCTGADVLYPLYPPFTEAPVTDTADFIYEVYREAVKTYGAENTAVVGGSYGGLLAMQLLTWINRRGGEAAMPALVILNSPFAFPETEEEWALLKRLEKKDLMVPEGSVKMMLEGVLRADTQTPGYALFPSRMDFRHAPETYVFYGEETCAFAADAIERAYARDGAVLHMHREPGMMHCYACAPVFPESRRDFEGQIRLLKGMNGKAGKAGK